MKRLCVLACLFLLGAHPAFAEKRSLGYAIWNVIGGSVRVLYIVPDNETKTLAAPGAPVPITKQVADYVLAHLSVSRQGRACPVIDQGQDVGLINTLALTPGLLRFEIVFECPDGEGMTLSDTAFSDRVENHVDFARVQIDNGGFVQHVFTAGAPRFDLPSKGATLQSDFATRYVTLGLSHAFRSAEILCFVLALLLIARRRRDYGLAFGALVAGYVPAILLSTFELAAPRFGTGQAFVGLLVAVAAATGVALSLPDPRRGAWALGAGALALALPALFFHGTAAALAVLGGGLLGVSTVLAPRRSDRRAIFLLIAPFLFGLLEGLTPAGDLAVLALPPAQLAPMLLGFDAGTLLGEVVLPLCLIGIWFAVPFVRKMAAPGGFLPDLAASVFIGCGVFWFGSWLLV